MPVMMPATVVMMMRSTVRKIVGTSVGPEERREEWVQASPGVAAALAATRGGARAVGHSRSMPVLRRLDLEERVLRWVDTYRGVSVRQLENARGQGKYDSVRVRVRFVPSLASQVSQRS